MAGNRAFGFHGRQLDETSVRRGKARCPCGREARSANAASAGSSQGGIRRWRCGLKLSGVKMPGAAITHPDRSQAFPIAPEMIRNVDGASKNDSGRNAAARLLADFRREHPHLKTIAIGDGFYLDGPCVKLLKSKNLRFMHGAGPGDHAFMFGWLKRRADVKFAGGQDAEPEGRDRPQSPAWAEDNAR